MARIASAFDPRGADAQEATRRAILSDPRFAIFLCSLAESMAGVDPSHPPEDAAGGAAGGERGGTARKRSTSGAGQPAERGRGPERGRSRKKQRQLAGGARGVGVDTGKEWRGDGDRMLDTRFGPSSM